MPTFQFSSPDRDGQLAEHGAALSEVGRLARRVRELEADHAAAIGALGALYDYARRWPAEDGSQFHVLLERAYATLKRAGSVGFSAEIE